MPPAAGFVNHADKKGNSMSMKTLEELDAEIAALEAEEKRLYEIVKAAYEVHCKAQAEWLTPFRAVEALKQKRAVLAELLETYRGQDKLAV